MATGASTSVAPAATPAGWSSGCASGSPSARSASRGCTRARLREEGLRGAVTILAGEYDGLDRGGDPPPTPTGRGVRRPTHPRETRAGDRARGGAGAQRICRIYGRRSSGTARSAARCCALVRELDMTGLIDVPGFVPAAEVDDALARALCLLLPSRREGYGLVVIEAAAQGTPSVVVAGPDNAAVELVARRLQRRRSRRRLPRRTWRRRSSRWPRADASCASPRPRGSPPTRSGCRSSTR